ncbi:MAG: CoA transferase [Actinomycetia bacterium]|nr:CoA transferase [Actinomycetes bacterium]MCP4225153.1 CoA transferase [Actinomycetes bacterium]MCP5033784.1 CoA transferase [Actinomycetes bacterium]
MALLMSGVRVLDVGTMTPGKYCTFLLADMGASVLRVERPASAGGQVAAEDLLLNRGKQSMTLDLRSERGQEILARLLDQTDVVIESHRPGVADRIGLGWSQLHDRWPNLVLCSLSGFGQNGPRSSAPAFDLNLLASSGMLSALTPSGTRPTAPAAWLSDAVSGLTATLAISAAVGAVGRGGNGVHLDIAMLDSIFSALSLSHGQRQEGGPVVTDPAALDPSPIYGIYEAADGRHLALAAWRPTSCRALFEELGRSDLEAKVWAGQQHAAEVTEFLTHTFMTAPAAEWIERLAPLDVEITLVATPDEAFEDSQLRARAMVVDQTSADGKTISQASSPIRIDGETRNEPLGAAPAIGADTADVLASVGVDPSVLAELRAEGVV